MRAGNIVRLSLGGVFVGAIVAVALWPETIEVDLAAASRQTLQVTVDDEGETRVRDRFVVSAPVAGRLRRVELEAGDPVRRGDVLLRFMPGDAPLLDARESVALEQASGAAAEAIGQARAERDRAAVALDRATAAERRFANLVDIGAVSREDFETMQSARAAAEAALRAAEHNVARTQRDWEAAQARWQPPPAAKTLVNITAPVDGVVLKRLRESEAVVAAGEPLMEIGDPRQIEVIADLLSSDAVRVRTNAPVSIERWGGGHAIAASVRRVEPSGFTKVSALGVEEQRVNVIISFDDPCAGEELGDAYRVEVRITTWRGDDVLAVPTGALFRSGADWAVFAYDSGRARLRLVQIGERNSELAQVTGGLQPGEKVILHPPDTVSDGTRIRARH